MLQFWQNPEFIRYARAELRPMRMVASVSVTVTVCGLLALLMWSGHDTPAEFWKDYFAFVLVLQCALIILWSLGACGQAFARERELQTFDFLRTTRLTAMELFIGKLFGVPVLGYVLLLITIPIGLVSGAMAGTAVWRIALVYLLLIIASLTAGSIGLWGSMLMERPNIGAGVALLVLMMPLWGIAAALSDSAASGISSAAFYPAVAELLQLPYYERVDGYFFGAALPLFVLAMILYASIVGWLALMIHRNLKKDMSEYRLLSNWQAVGLTVFLNVLFYGFLNIHWRPRYGQPSPEDWLIPAAGMLNTLLLFMVGLAAIMPAERLRAWWRANSENPQRHLSLQGMPWTAIALSGIVGFVALMLKTLASGAFLPPSALFAQGICLFLAITIFVMRDVMFLQWCNLTKMKHPIVKGILFLGLYYFAAGTVIAVIAAGSEEMGVNVAMLLTPAMWFDPDVIEKAIVAGIGGLIINFGWFVFLLRKITGRISRPAKVAAVAA